MQLRTVLYPPEHRLCCQDCSSLQSDPAVLGFLLQPTSLWVMIWVYVNLPHFVTLPKETCFERKPRGAVGHWMLQAGGQPRYGLWARDLSKPTSPPHQQSHSKPAVCGEPSVRGRAAAQTVRISHPSSFTCLTVLVGTLVSVLALAPLGPGAPPPPEQCRGFTIASKSQGGLALHLPPPYSLLSLSSPGFSGATASASSTCPLQSEPPSLPEPPAFPFHPS